MVSFQYFMVNFQLVLHLVLIFILLTYFYCLNNCWFGYMLMCRATLNVAAEAIIKRSPRKLIHVKEFIFSKDQRLSTYSNWGHCSISPQFLEKVSKVVPKFKIFRGVGPTLLKLGRFLPALHQP